MQPFKKLIYLNLVVVFLGSCSTIYPVQIQRFGSAHEPNHSEVVEVLYETPERPFIEIARLSTESMNYDNPGHAVARLRGVAADCGADALIIEKRGTRQASSLGNVGRVDGDFGFGPPVGGPVTPASGGYNSASFAKATAIRWLDRENPASRPAKR
ncbi:MAG: hypothetical protein ACKVS6_06785 [Planctomycetota bacterium]